MHTVTVLCQQLLSLKVLVQYRKMTGILAKRSLYHNITELADVLLGMGSLFCLEKTMLTALARKA